MGTRKAFAEYNIEERSSSLRGSVMVGSFSVDGPGPHTTVPHRHDFIELVWLSQGTGSHVIDTTEFPVLPRALYTIGPGQIHFWKPGDVPLEGTIVLFREDFLTGPGGLPARTWTGGMALPDTATAVRIDRLLDEARAEVASDAADRDTVLRFLLSALVTVCARIQPHAAQPRHALAAAFSRLVGERRSAALTVVECARTLNVTPNHLTEVVTADTGHPPGAVIRAAVLLEAQRMLTGTTLTGAQIAAALQFDDPSYFSRFFRRETGVTPTAYRAARSAVSRAAVT